MSREALGKNRGGFVWGLDALGRGLGAVLGRLRAVLGPSWAVWGGVLGLSWGRGGGEGVRKSILTTPTTFFEGFMF